MTFLRESVKGMRLTDVIFFGGYALYLVFSYMAFHSETLLSSGTGIGYDDAAVFLFAVLGARVVIFSLITALFRSLKEISLPLVSPITGVFALVGFLILAMVFHFSSAIEAEMFLPWLIMAAISLGIADAFITLMWARFSSTLSLRTVYLYVLLCAAVGTVLYLIVSFLPPVSALPIAIMFYVTSLVFAHISLNKRDPVTWEYSPDMLYDAIKRIWYPLLGTGILCFMSGLMLRISSLHEVSLDEFQMVAAVSTGLAIACLLLPALFVKKSINMGRIYMFALPLSAAGFLLLPLISNVAGAVVNSFAQLGAMVASIILWCMVADLVRQTKLPSFLLFASVLTLTNAAELAGSLVGYVNAETLQQSDVLLTAVALVAVYLLLMAGLFVFKDRTFRGSSDATDVGMNQEELFSQRCERIAQTYRFTPRETEIFVLLAQGYTMPIISGKLYVSENTVKSHVKSIYSKLNIHARSELIELANRD